MATISPSRMTVMRSAICSASSIACEMKTIDTPLACSRLSRAKKCRFSSGVRDRRWLVEHDDLSVVVNRPSDLNHLPLGGAEGAYGGIWIHGKVQRLQELLGGNVGAAQPAEERRRTEIEVVRDRHRRDQTGFLKHHGNAGLKGGMRRGKVLLASLVEHRSRTRLDHPGNDLCQRRLARAILAEQRMDLALP